MTEQSQESKVLKKEDQLDINYVSKLFIHTFRHSQGIPNTQHYIFYYIQKLHPEWHITDTQLKEIKERTLNPIITFTNVEKDGTKRPHSVQTWENVQNDFATNLHEFQVAINNGSIEKTTRDFLVNHIGESVLNADITYLRSKKGRPNRKNNKDRYFSFFRELLLNSAQQVLLS